MGRKGTGHETPEADKDQKPTLEATAENKIDDEGLSAAIPEEMPEDTNMVSVEDEGEEGVQSPEPPKVKMFRIIIDEQDNSDKNGPVRCTDGQGKQYLIKRGYEVDVPEGVVNVIKESVFTVYDKENGKEIERHIPRFAMRIIKEL